MEEDSVAEQLSNYKKGQNKQGENPVLVIVRGIKYNETYKILTGGILHGKLSESGKFFVLWKSSL